MTKALGPALLSGVTPKTLVDLHRIGLVERARDDAFLRKVDGVFRPVASREVAERIRRVCAALIDLGIRPGDRVAILSETRLEWAVADFAVLTAGAVTVPIYPTLPAVQIEPLLADSEVAALFCSTTAHFEKVLASWPRLPSLRLVVLFEGQVTTRPLPGRVLPLPEFEAMGVKRLEREPRLVEERADSVTPDHLASIIYTSGTTGTPKGVMLTHANFVANVLDALHVFQISPADTTLSHLPLSHVFERMAGQFSPVLAGARVAYADSIETLPANILEVHPTIVMSVPRLFEKILERAQSVAEDVGGYAILVFRWSVAVGVAWSRAAMKGRVSPPLALARRLADRVMYSRLRARMGGNIRCLISGGAPLDSRVAHVLHAAGIPLFEGYGLTETSPVIAVNREGQWRIGTVGPPLPSVEVKIAEDGEILVRGPSVMKGYYRKPRETAEAIDGDGWFHTGDLGQLVDGFLSITGRKKDLIVNAGGKKIAPQPIEDMLRRIPLVSEALLVGDRRPYCVALLWPNVPALEIFARRQGLPASDLATLAKDPHVLEFLRREIDAGSAALASFERVKRFALVPGELSLAQGEITPSLKIRRGKVLERYADLVESLYAD
ncbi:MAG TPA: long-chain fatty acid--CoA ligase [Candidatus Eisenbacteria bacterium]|nr:long-chain fatty acid--CoA ligase [Candidatus Eisenbacteria bacterium]